MSTDNDEYLPTQDEWQQHLETPSSAAVGVFETVPVVDLTGVNQSSPTGGLPAIKGLSQLLHERRQGLHATPAELIGGVLHMGCKMLLGGHSKANKSWALLDLAIKVSAGADWWGFATAKGRVLFINFELQEWSAIDRIAAMLPIARLDGVDTVAVVDGVDIWTLRGHAADLFLLLPKFKAAIQSGGYSLIIIDPLYKMLGDADENSAGDMANIFNQLEELIVESGAAMVVSHHFAKGNASGKSVQDRMSGSGVMARDVDSMVILTPHEQPNCFVAEFVLRHFAAPSPFVLRMAHPFLIRDDSMDATELRQHNGGGGGGAPKKASAEDVLRIIGGGLMAEPELVRAICDRYKVTPRTAQAKIVEALQARLIENIGGTFRKVVDY